MITIEINYAEWFFCEPTKSTNEKKSWRTDCQTLKELKASNTVRNLKRKYEFEVEKDDKIQ